MDYEYNLTGELIDVNKEFDFETKELTIPGLPFFLLLKNNPQNKNSAKISLKVELKNKADAEKISDKFIEEIGQKMSLLFKSKMILKRTCLEYGLLNVFNGGSDYEIINEKVVIWHFEKGFFVNKEEIQK